MKLNYNILRIFIIVIFLLIFISYINDKKYRYNGIIDKSHFSKNRRELNFPIHEKTSEIPKTIYRIWFGPEKKENKKIAQNIKKVLPNYQIIEINNYKQAENFILDNYNQYVLDKFNLISKDYPACKSDLLRLLIIYCKGGVYVDCKTGIIKDITSILEKNKGKLLVFNSYDIPFHNSFWTQTVTWENWSLYGEFCNWGFSSNKGNPILREVINNVLHNIEISYKNKEKYNTGFPYILSITGPHIFTWSILNTKHKESFKVLKSNFNGKFKYSQFKHDNSKDHWKKNDKKLFV